jgi:hypothetical protein
MSQRHTRANGTTVFTPTHTRALEDVALSLADGDMGDADGVAFWAYVVDGGELTEGQIEAVACWCMGMTTPEIARVLCVCKDRAAQQVEAGLVKAYRHFNGHEPPRGTFNLRYLRGDKVRSA